MDFEACKYRAKLKDVDRVAEPERPLPAGKTEHANDRGTRIHEAAELFVKGGVELVKELAHFREDFEELRRLHAEGRVSLEGEWAVDRDWAPVAWNSSTAWNRMKLDAFVQTSETSGRVIDYKTGRRFGNEVKHTEQGQVYQLATFLRYPSLEVLTVEFWYTDQNEKDVKSYTRAQGMAYFDKYDSRFSKVTGCTEFTPNPNMFTCKWCAYKGGVCEYGIESGPSIPKKDTATARLKELRKLNITGRPG